MPFKSRKQERYLQINEPEIYQDWVEEYGHFSAESLCIVCNDKPVDKSHPNSMGVTCNTPKCVHYLHSAESDVGEVLSIVNPSGRSENDDLRKLYVSIGFRDGEIYRGYVELDSEYEMDEKGYQRKKAESFSAESGDKPSCGHAECMDLGMDGWLSDREIVFKYFTQW